MGVLDVTLPVGQTAAQLVAALAPVPGLSPALDLFVSIVMLCQNVSGNRKLIAQLRDRCASLLQVLPVGNSSPEKLRNAIYLAKTTLQTVHDKFSEWEKYSTSKAFFQQSEIANGIKRLHEQIDNCLEGIGVVSHIGIHQWIQDFEANQKSDQADMMKSLSDIQNSQRDILAQGDGISGDVQTMMTMMQKLLSMEDRHEPQQQNLQANLYQLSRRSGGGLPDLLPELNLARGEVQRIGQYPVSSNTTMDIWEGLYLQSEKVAVRAVRALDCKPRTLQRFMREAQIWAEIQKIDGGCHVLPFYGVCFNDGPFPYMVSPWQQNGSAIDYVKKYDASVDYRSLTRGIAEGLRVLHTMQPPVVHGHMKGENIIIGNMGQPLLANFGLAKVVEDVKGIPFTQSSGIAESYRWFAPEVCMGDGCLSMNADIYAFGMTILELMTHHRPYSNIKHTFEVANRSAKGEVPARPIDNRVIERGLDDGLWALLTICWKLDPMGRPNIHEVLSRC